MSDYWENALCEIFGDHGVTASTQQIAAIAKDVAGAAEVETEYSGIVEQTKPGRSQKSPERLRIDRLEDCIRRLSARYNIGIDPDSMEISYLTPVGTSHMGTHREAI